MLAITRSLTNTLSNVSDGGEKPQSFVLLSQQLSVETLSGENVQCKNKCKM